MKIEYNNGIFLWILYSENTGDILRVCTNQPHRNDEWRKPKGCKWGCFITTEKNIQKIFKYYVTKNGLEKKVTRNLVTR